MSPQLNAVKTKQNQQVLIKTTMNPHDEVFIRAGMGLYAWQPQSWVDNGQETGFKFGEYGTYAEHGKVPQDTITEYSGVTVEPNVILYAIRLTDEQIAIHGTAYDIEQKLAAKWPRSNRGGSSTEVYDVTLEVIKNDIQDLLYPPSIGFFHERKNSYRPRLRQEEAINKAVKWFTKRNKRGERNFLLDALPRFGKNFTVLQIALRVVPTGGNILVITSRPDTFATLKKDINTHYDFDNMVYSELKDKKDTWKPRKDKINVLAVSPQLLNNPKNRNLLDFLNTLNWHLKFIDEADTGMLTELSTDMLDKLPSKYTIWASGTAQKLQSTGKFLEENTYRYDYIQQQTDKRDGIASTDAVTLTFYNIDVPPEVANQKKWYTDDEDFTFTKLLAYNEETNMFVHEGDVVSFLESIFGKRPRTKYSPYKIVSNLDHTIWVLPPSRNAVRRLKKLIEDINGDEYKVFAATDDETDDINDIIKHTMWYPKHKSITLTINRFTRGSTVESWRGVFVMNDTESLEYYIQSIFRPTTPDNNKPEAFVFDFSPNRSFEMLGEYCRHIAQNKNITNPTDVYRELLDVCNIFSVDGVMFRKHTLDDMMRAVKQSDHTANVLRKSGRFYIESNILNLMSPQLSELILGLAKDSTGKLNVVLTESDYTNKGKNYHIIKNPQSSSRNLDEKTKKDIVAKIATLISRLPVVSELGYTTVEDIITHVPDDMFYGATECDKKILMMLVKEKLIDTYKINIHLA